MKQKALSIITALALCICMAAGPKAYAWQGAAALQADFLSSAPAPREGTEIPTPQQAYAAMIALQNDERYKEGTAWTNDTPYSLSAPYIWQGGKLQPGNVNGGAGCAAFAFLLSDKAFGSLPARMTATIDFSQIKVGDILRVNQDTHTVIVLQVTDVGVVIAEGNYNKSVHWGRTMTKEEVEAASYHITRYPEGYTPPDDPAANQPVTDGTGALTTGLTWTLTNAGTLTIAGAGNMPDFAEGLQPWNQFNSKILKIVVQSGVTSIGSYAFSGCSALSVEVPASVETIGGSAFRECRSLISVSLPEGVGGIGDNAFRACGQLKSITLPASITSVGAGAFMECTELAEATFTPGNNQVTMGSSVFTECWRLASIQLPQRIDCISENMFYNCMFLTNLTVPDGVASIGGSAFVKCNLSSIYIPATVKEIGISAFPLPATLRDVYYGGDETSWNAIQKVPTVTQALSNATIHYNSSAPETPPETPPSTHTHSWDKGEVTSQPTCTEDGTRTYHCTGCSETKTEAVPAKGHSFTGDEDNGYTCSNCSTEVSPAVKAGYDIVEATVKVPSGTRADQAYQSEGSVKQYVSALIDKAMTDESGFQYSIDTISYTPPTRAAEGEYVYTVTLRPVTRAAAGELKTERFYMVIPKISDPVPPSNPGASTGSYRVSVSPAEGGEITTSPAYAAPGKLVTVNVAPDTGFVVKGITVTGPDGSPLSVSGSGGAYTFTMPKGSVTITADIVSLFSQFTDIPTAIAEYSEAIEWAVGQGITIGTGETAFSPNAACTRAQMAVFLYRAAGSPADVSGTNPFTDIPADNAELQKAVQWAFNEGITKGTGGASFDPAAPCTRAEMAAFLYRAHGEPAAAGTNGFADVPADAFYHTAIQWAVNEGIARGYSDTAFGPYDACTRVQMVTFLYRDRAE